MAVKIITQESHTPVLFRHDSIRINKKPPFSDCAPIPYKPNYMPIYYDTSCPNTTELHISLEPLDIKELFVDSKINIKVDNTLLSAGCLYTLNVEFNTEIYRFPVLIFKHHQDKNLFFLTTKFWKRLNTMYDTVRPEWVSNIQDPAVSVLFATNGCGLKIEEDKYFNCDNSIDENYYFLRLSSYLRDAVFETFESKRPALVVLYDGFSSDFIEKSNKLKNEEIHN